MKSGGRHALNPSGGTAPERQKNDARRSTRLSRQIPVVITSLDPARNSSGKYETVVVNAHGCGVIASERLEKETRVTVELIASGRSKQARIVLAISLVEGISWLLGLEFDSPARLLGDRKSAGRTGRSNGVGSRPPLPNHGLSSATQITATFTLASNASSGPVSVITSGGTSGGVTFTVNPPPPTLTSIGSTSGNQGTSEGET